MRYEIEQDKYADNPRLAWDHYTTMVCFHKRYDLGDKHNYKSTTFDGWADVKRHLVEEKKAVLIEPLYLYDHSGITMSTRPFSCPWDSGQVGFIYMTEKDIEAIGFSDDLQKAEEYLLAEVAEYDSYITGDVYVISWYDDEDELIETVGGYYGYDYAKEEAQKMLEYYQSEKENNHV